MPESANNLDQIRELLFGSQLDNYESQFKTYGDRLTHIEETLTNFRNQIQGQLQQIEGTISDELLNLNQNLENKLKQFSNTSDRELIKLDQNITVEMTSFTTELQAFQKDFGQQNDALKSELEAIRKELDIQLSDLKESISNEWRSKYNEANEGKLTKDHLGKMLFEFSLKTRNGSALAELPEGVKDQMEARLES